jgi:hypothetical protein
VLQTFMSVNAAVQYRQPEGSQELDEKKKRLFGDDQKKASVVLGKQMKDRITFDDVAGIGEAKLELMEVSVGVCGVRASTREELRFPTRSCVHRSRRKGFQGAHRSP